MKFEVYKDRAGEWRWRFVTTFGRTIADSGEGYANRSDCENGILLIQIHAPSAPITYLN